MCIYEKSEVRERPNQSTYIEFCSVQTYYNLNQKLLSISLFQNRVTCLLFMLRTKKVLTYFLFRQKTVLKKHLLSSLSNVKSVISSDRL